MWEFFQEVFKSGGLLSLVLVGAAAALVHMYRTVQAKDKQLLEMSDKRLEDAIENKEDIEEVAKNLQRSLDTLIKVWKKD